MRAKQKLLSILLILLAVQAHAVDARLMINWQAPTENVDGTPLTDLAGYKIYWKLSAITPYSQSVTIGDSFANTHNLDLLALESGTRVWVVMTAYDLQLPVNESGYSNEIIFGPFLEADETSPRPPAVSGEAAILNCPVGMVCQIGNL